MKVSEISVDNLVDYMKLDDFKEEEIEAILTASKAFIRSYTNLSDEEIDNHEDFYIVVMILCQDMYDNRVLYPDKNNLNKVVNAILGMHRKNLL